jgi:hypothetical protein
MPISGGPLMFYECRGASAFGVCSFLLARALFRESKSGIPSSQTIHI